MPPSMRIPGSRKQLWFLPDVLRWLQRYRAGLVAAASGETTHPKKRRRRPTKLSTGTARGDSLD